MDIRKMKAAVIDALEEIKAKNIVVLNVSKLTSLFDYLVVASGDSNRQTRALADNVKERLKAAGATIYGTEGEESGEWVLVDLGDIVVHAMVPATRDYYRLEDLWREGKLEFPKPAARKPASAKAAPAKAEKSKATGAKSKTGTKAKIGAKATGKTRAGTTVKAGTRAKAGTSAKTGNHKAKAGSRAAAGTTVKVAGKIKTGSKLKTGSRTKTANKAKTGSGTAATARTKAITATARRKKAV
jgi:ribosome-associated protein